MCDNIMRYVLAACAYAACVHAACDTKEWAATCAIPCTDALLDAARARRRHGEPLFVTWVDAGNVQLFKDHWRPRAVGRNASFIVVAADEPTAAEVYPTPAVVIDPLPRQFLEANCTGSRGAGDCMRRYHVIAYTKLSVSRCLVAHGMSVVIMDVDAFITGDLKQLIARADADVLTIMDDQRHRSRKVPLEHYYAGEKRWGIPVYARYAAGGPGARTGHCLAVAFFGSSAAVEKLLAYAQGVFADVFTAWWAGAALPDGLPWAATPQRTLLQQSFAWALASTVGGDGVAALHTLFDATKSSCEPVVQLIGGLRLGYMPYDDAFDPGADRWCRNVACNHSTWVVHCFGTAAEKTECARNIAYN